MLEKENSSLKNLSGDTKKMSRRDILKSLSTIPVFGLFAAELLRKQSLNQDKKNEILKELGLNNQEPHIQKSTSITSSGQQIRLGIIGCGSRSGSLLRSLGFGHPEWIANQKKIDSSDYQERMNQGNLNVVVTGICDVFDLHADKALEIAKSPLRPEYISGSPPAVKRYNSYHDMLASSEIDAVVIASPDHQHAQMTIDAAEAGKHVYCEKCMTRTEEETLQVKEVINRTGVAFQLGHQYSQSATFFQAREVIKKNILGKITLVETSTNRNTPHGAWIRHMDKKGNVNPGSPENIDWKQWLGASPEVPFSIKRYYNWPTYFDYSTGLVGELFSHEYDAVNQLLELGIPKSVVASGGVYYFKDGRKTPDVFHAVFEYPDRKLTVLYSASLANSRARRRVFMGHDASMELGSNAIIMADQNSTRYSAKIEDGVIDTRLPLFNYKPGSMEVDAITSATEQYYATRGLVNTYRDGKRVNIAHLHLQEWLDVIRNGGILSCGIDRGFEVTMTCHMATRSYLEKRRVEWDAVNQRIV